MEDLICEYQSTRCKIEEEGIYKGFSKRLNTLLDSARLNAPKLNEGRGAWLAKISGASKPATSDWLLRDKPPKQTRLRTLIILISNYLPDEDKNIPMLEAWVLYGDGKSWMENLKSK